MNWANSLFACHFSLLLLPCIWDYLLLLTVCFSVLLLSPSSYNPVSLWVCFSTSPPFHHPSSLSCSTSPFPALSQLLTIYFSPLTLLLLPSFPASMSFSSSSLPLISPFLPSPCSVRDKFVEVDLKPVCKHCYERLPDDMKRRLAKRERDSKEKKKKLLIPMCL